mmetsp:Transcript_1641/g.4944  ORF Transcript_1641/g.4944 Transcript_1641/m.4944 type:complete len:228 (-) Transcript_1641:365-1048(-)
MRREDRVGQRRLLDDARRVPESVLRRPEARDADGLQRRAGQVRRRNIRNRVLLHEDLLASPDGLFVAALANQRKLGKEPAEVLDEGRLSYVCGADDEDVAAAEDVEHVLAERDQILVHVRIVRRVKGEGVDGLDLGAALLEAVLEVLDVRVGDSGQQIRLRDGEDDGDALDEVAQAGDDAAFKVGGVDYVDAEAESPPLDDVLELLLKHLRPDVAQRVVGRPDVALF